MSGKVFESLNGKPSICFREWKYSKRGVEYLGFSLSFLFTKVWLIVRAENEWKQIMTRRTQLLINFHKFWWHFTPIVCKVKDTFNNIIKFELCICGHFQPSVFRTSVKLNWIPLYKATQSRNKQHTTMF